MIVGDLLAHIGFKTEEAPLERLEHQLESIREKINLIIGFEAVAKLYELAERFAHWGEELHITATNLGLTTEALQGLDFAAEHAGVSQEMLGHSLAHLSRHLYDAKNGSVEAMQAFAKAGFTPDTLARFKTSEDALYALADRLNKIQDPLQRMGVAQTLLGRGGFKMIAFLSQGSAAIKEQAGELRKLGLQLSGPQIEALVQTEHAFIRLRSVLSAMGAQVASYVGPAFSFLVDKFIALYDANQNLARGGIKSWLDTLLYGLGFAAGLVYDVTKRLAGMGGAIGDAFKGKGVGGAVDVLASKLDDVIHKLFSPDNLNALTKRLEEMMAGDTFAKALKLGLDAALIASGWALAVGYEIAKGITATLSKVIPNILFGEDTASFGELWDQLFSNRTDEEKKQDKGDAAENKKRINNDISRAVDIAKNLAGDAWDKYGIGGSEKVTVPKSALKGSMGRVDFSGGGLHYTSAEELAAKEEADAARARRKPAGPLATTPEAALGGTINNNTIQNQGGDVNIHHGPTSIHQVIPPGASAAQTKAHAEKAAEGIYSARDAEARRAHQQSLAPGGS